MRYTMKILKKWWFWVIVIFIIILIIALGEENENIDNDIQPDVTTTLPSQTQPETTIPATTGIETTQEQIPVVTTTKIEVTDNQEIRFDVGTYKVGTDMPAGEYKLYSTNTLTGSYIEVAKDSKGTLDSIIANALFNTFIYVTVDEGQYFKMRDCYAVPAEQAEKYEPEDETYIEGMYKVGFDIPAGEYRAFVDKGAILGMGYIEVAHDSSHRLDSIISNENIQENTYITVEDGQYLSIRSVYLRSADN